MINNIQPFNNKQLYISIIMFLIQFVYSNDVDVIQPISHFMIIMIRELKIEISFFYYGQPSTPNF